MTTLDYDSDRQRCPEMFLRKMLLDGKPSQIFSHQANSCLVFKKINTVFENAEQITNKKGTSIDFEINQ